MKEPTKNRELLETLADALLSKSSIEAQGVSFARANFETLSLMDNLSDVVKASLPIKAPDQVPPKKSDPGNPKFSNPTLVNALLALNRSKNTEPRPCSSNQEPDFVLESVPEVQAKPKNSPMQQSSSRSPRTTIFRA